MNTLIYFRLNLIILLSLILIACGGGEGSGTPVTKTIQEVLDGSVTLGVDSVIVYVEQKDQAPIVYFSGVRDRTTQQPIDPNELFKIASISKLFIAVATTKLAHQNDLSLDDTLAFWLPTLASRIENANTITIRQIIQHRSGIPDFDSQAGFSWQDAHTNIDQTLEFALDLSADFSPNNRYEYSNTNYLLLGKILDSALGYNHKIYIQDNILTPLEMQNTYYLYDDIDPSFLIKGYWDVFEFTNQDYAIPGGSMISTAEDTAIFLRALQGDLLMNEQERNLYAYFYNHSGWVPGYQSRAIYHSDIDTVVVQFVSTTGGNSESIAESNYNSVIRILRSR